MSEESFAGFIDDYYAESEEHLTRPGLRCWSSRRRVISLRTSTASSTTSFDSSTR